MKHIDKDSPADIYLKEAMEHRKMLPGCSTFQLELAGSHLVLPIDDFGEGEPGTNARSKRKLMQSMST